MTSEERIESAQGLVRSLALKAFAKAPRGVLLDDLIQYGQLGLAEAARSYKEGAAEFSTFAYYRVRGAIYDGLSQMTGWSRSQRRNYQYQRASGAHLQELAEADPGKEETLSQQFDWLIRTTRELATVYLAAGETDADSSMQDHRFLRPDHSAEHAELIGKLHEAISELPEAEGEVLKLFYFEGLTLTEVARRHGKDKSWASRAHSRAISELARVLRPAVDSKPLAV